MRRSLKIAPVFAPIMILASILGSPYGAAGVAFAYSAATLLWMVPHIVWCLYGTAVSLRNVASAVIRPLTCAVIAGGVGYAVRLECAAFPWLLLRLALEAGALVVTFFCSARAESVLSRSPTRGEQGKVGSELRGELWREI